MVLEGVLQHDYGTCAKRLDVENLAHDLFRASQRSIARLVNRFGDIILMKITILRGQGKDVRALEELLREMKEEALWHMEH